MISLVSLFGIESDFYVITEDSYTLLDDEKTLMNDVKNIKYIAIDGFFNISADNTRDELFEFLLEDIPWIDAEQRNNSKIVILQKYYSHSIVMCLKAKANEYLAKNNLLDHSVKIHEYTGYQIKYVHSTINVAELSTFNRVAPLKLYGIGYGLELNGMCKDHTLSFQLESNNMRHEWITHLDYAIYIHQKTDQLPSSSTMNDEKNATSINTKLVNDFTIQDEEKKQQEFSSNFSFGIYLNYWEPGYDNSVIPKYPTLKNELLNNTISKIARKNYYSLYEICKQLMQSNGYKCKAETIGVNNKKFNVCKGTVITVNHLIALKLYTDYGHTQKRFKKHCRKRDATESLSDFIERNSVIANWCRYLKESCTFWGKIMQKKDIVYTGMNKKLLFTSLDQFFECPLSTTKSINIAQTFCKDHGILLKLKATNDRTRYFNVSWLSHYKHEEERLFMGSSLKISDIFINGNSHKIYIQALQLLEKIIDGQFIDCKTETESILYDIVAHIMNFIDCKTTESPPKYMIALCEGLIQRIKNPQNFYSIWINKQELQKIKHSKLQCLFIGCAQFFRHFNLDLLDINTVQQYNWIIENDECKEFVMMKPRKYIESNKYRFDIDDNETIQFHLECCLKYSDVSQKCALFLHLDSLPSYVEAIRISYDLICDYGKKSKYRHQMPPQWLSINGKFEQYCGFQTFSSKNVSSNKPIKWIIGVKITDKTYITSHNSSNYTHASIEHIASALKYNDKKAVMEMFKSLVEENQRLNEQLEQYQHSYRSGSIQSTPLPLIYPNLQTSHSQQSSTSKLSPLAGSFTFSGYGSNNDNYQSDTEEHSSAFPSTYQHFGYLDIRTKKEKPWKLRYFVVNNNFLLSAATPHSKQLDRVIPLEGCNIVCSKKSTNKLFELLRRKYKLYFRAASTKQCNQWIDAIKKASKFQITDIYRFLYALSTSLNTKVVVAKHRTSNKHSAIKIVDKKVCDQKLLKNEIQILKKLDNQYIVRIYDLIETKKNLYIVMEQCEGGELFDQMAEMKNEEYNQDDFCLISHQIANAVNYMHGLGLIHKDLKPANILCIKPGSIRKVKIADFGVSKIFINYQNKNIEKIPLYSAPEILINKSYDHRVDYWNVGVILFVLLCGRIPFDDTNIDLLNQLDDQLEVLQDKYSWQHIPIDVRNLVLGLLSKYPTKRKCCDDILKLSWTVTIKSSSFIASRECFKQTVAKLKFNRHSLTLSNTTRECV